MEESVAVICSHLRRCLELRERYMDASGQLMNPKDRWTLADIEAAGRALDPSTIPGPNGTQYAMSESGVFGPVIITNDLSITENRIPTVQEYYADFEAISQLCADGPTKTWSFRRLRLLSSHFQLHLLQNEQAEREQQKRVRHRDFYNVRKIDTHVHHSSSMNCKHLLRFIKSKLREAHGDVVTFRDGQHLTLQQVFDSLHLTAYDLSIDALDMHAHKDSFHRFDRFNLKYNPLGEARLREIFLKTNNLIGGRYLAELTKEVFGDLETSKYQMAEYRLSIYGRDAGEWKDLARWAVGHSLYSDNVRWIIQIPRLYHLYRSSQLLMNFEAFLLSTNFALP